MTAEMMNLRTFVEKTPNADVLRDMIAFAAERLMELEVGALTGAPHGEKTPTVRCNATAIATAIGRPGRHGRAAHPHAPQGQLLPRLPSNRDGWPRRRSPP
jgi:hypothetical protein